MTDHIALERRYRRLLSWYPREFRRDHEEEIISVLMSCAREGQRRPDLASSVDLIRSGLLMRLRPRLPRSTPAMRTAVGLMYAGAAVTFLCLIAVLVALPLLGWESTVLHVGNHTEPIPVAIVAGAGIALATTGLWLWMAQANSRGRSWARMCSTALVGFETIHLLLGTTSAVTLAFTAVTWAIGVVAVSLLWRPSSSKFFDQRTRAPSADDGA